MRSKEQWSRSAILADIIRRLGKELSRSKMWEKYVFLCETTSEGCELADKASILLFTDPEIKKIMVELKEFYG